MKKVNYYKKALKLLEQLHTEYPTQGIGQHITTAMADYGDFWGISDKEFCFALEKYKTELDLDAQNMVSESYVEKIVKDAQNLEALFNEEDEDGSF